MSASNQAELIYTFMHFEVSSENRVGLIRDTNTLEVSSLKNQKVLFCPHIVSLYLCLPLCVSLLPSLIPFLPLSFSDSLFCDVYVCSVYTY